MVTARQAIAKQKVQTALRSLGVGVSSPFVSSRQPIQIRGASFGGGRVVTRDVSSADIRSAYLKPGLTSITDPRTGYVAGEGTARYREIYKQMQKQITATAQAAAAKARAKVIESAKTRAVETGLNTEKKAIEREVTKLNVQKTRIDNLQSSMITRSTPSTNRLVSEYNQASTNLQNRIEQYNRKKTAVELKATEIAEVKPKPVRYVSPTPVVSPISGIDVKKTIMPEEAGFVREWRVPTDPIARQAYLEGRGYAEPYLSSERIKAATKAEFDKMFLLGAGLATVASGGSAYAVSGLTGLGVFGAEIGGGLIAGEVVTKKAPLVLKTLFPGKTEETYKVAAEALGIAGFVVGAKATGWGIRQLPGMGEIGAFGIGKRKLKLPEKIEVRKVYRDPLTIMPKGKKVKVTELGKFLEPARPLQYEEKIFLKTISLQKIKTPYKLSTIKPVIKLLPRVSPPTTAGLFVGKPLSLKQFVSKIGKIAKPPTPIPGSYAALAVGLSKAVAAQDYVVQKRKLTPIEKGMLKQVEAETKARQRFPDYLDVGLMPAITMKVLSKEITKQRKIEMVKPFEKQLLRISPKTVIKTKEKIIPIIKTSDVLKQAEKAISIPRQVYITIPKQIVPKRKRYIEEKKEKFTWPKIVLLPKIGLKLTPYDKSLQKMAQGFRLEVKRKGKWLPAFKGVFTEKSAKGLAQQLVGGTPLASFRIAKAYGIPKMVSGLPIFRPEQFRRPIRKGKFVPSDIFIEKTKFRIDQPGELKGITYKGLEALSLLPKKRRKKKKTKKKKKRR